MDTNRIIVVGGAGFVGRRIAERALANGSDVVVVDRRPAPAATSPTWIQADLLTEDVDLPEGDVILAHGVSDPRVLRPWTLVQDNALATARLLPQLSDRRVTLLSSIEVYGWAPGPLRVETEPMLPVSLDKLVDWTQRATLQAGNQCPPWRAIEVCSSLAESDPTGRWVYALSKAAQEVMVASAVRPDHLVILRIANLFGIGQDRVISSFIRSIQQGRTIKITPSVRTFVSVENLVLAALANLDPGIHLVGEATVTLADLADRIMTLVGQRVPIHHMEPPSPDSCGVVQSERTAHAFGDSFDEDLERFVRALSQDDWPAFDPPMQVVTPPRPEHPDLVAGRQQEAMWSGRVKYGNRWTKQLEERLREDLQIGPDRRIVATCSGTAALRLGVQAVAGRAAPGDVAVLPSFTFAATGEILVQMGYRLCFCDVDPATWTMDSKSLAAILDAEPRVKIVVPVDALGNPVAYDELRIICDKYHVPMMADSAPSLGSIYKGNPVGTQASAHAFSMSFAKVVSAAGAGGAVIVPAEADLEAQGNWLRSSLMGELNAIAALDQLEVLEVLVERREAIARVYRDTCRRHPSLRWQEVRSGDRHSLVHWVVQIPPHTGRERIANDLARVGVETKPYYDPVLHEVLSGIGTTEPKVTLPVTQELAATALALPMSSEMTPSQAEAIAQALEAAIDRAAKDARSSLAYSSF